MQNVVFVVNGQSVARIAMDVPRYGEQVVLDGQLYTVAALRYFVVPNGPYAAVALAPAAADGLISESFDRFSAAIAKNDTRFLSPEFPKA
jgi:hypothetical protein